MSTAGRWYPPPAIFEALPSAGTGNFLLRAMDLPNRDEHHGGMQQVGCVSQHMKQYLRHGKNWDRLTFGEQEALDMICHKIARILSGADPHSREHWEDVAGYAVAAMRDRGAHA